MSTSTTVRQGTAAWFEMVGAMMSEAASQAHLPLDLNVSLVERYTDGVELSDGLVQGIRLDMRGGKLSFKVGVRRDEQAEIMNELTAAAAWKLNTLHNSDPSYKEARDHFLNTGEMRVTGDPLRMGDWFEAVHDPIVDRTS